MAERHKSKQVLKIAQDLIHKLQTLIENKWFRFIDHSRCSKGGKAERICLYEMFESSLLKSRTTK